TPPRPLRPPLFPYTTLFRSLIIGIALLQFRRRHLVLWIFGPESLSLFLDFILYPAQWKRSHYYRYRPAALAAIAEHTFHQLLQTCSFHSVQIGHGKMRRAYQKVGVLFSQMKIAYRFFNARNGRFRSCKQYSVVRHIFEIIQPVGPLYVHVGPQRGLFYLIEEGRKQIGFFAGYLSCISGTAQQCCKSILEAHQRQVPGMQAQHIFTGGIAVFTHSGCVDPLLYMLFTNTRAQAVQRIAHILITDITLLHRTIDRISQVVIVGEERVIRGFQQPNYSVLNISHQLILFYQKVTCALVSGIPATHYLISPPLVHLSLIAGEQKRAAVHIGQIHHANEPSFSLPYFF